jgi:Fe-S-cluster containining protein
LKECNQCGKCCIKYGDGGIEATIEEIDMWEIFRPHIYQYVRNYKLWFDPKTQKPLTTCPFLEKVPVQKSHQRFNHEKTDQIKYTCAIYEDRPEDCRLYPSSINEMIRDECEMIEIVDLTQPQKAQKALDKLMSDSRPRNSN